MNWGKKIKTKRREDENVFNLFEVVTPSSDDCVVGADKLQSLLSFRSEMLEVWNQNGSFNQEITIKFHRNKTILVLEIFKISNSLKNLFKKLKATKTNVAEM